MALAAIHVKKPREAQIWNCCIGNPVLRILPDSNILKTIFSRVRQHAELTDINGSLAEINVESPACGARSKTTIVRKSQWSKSFFYRHSFTHPFISTFQHLQVRLSNLQVPSSPFPSHLTPYDVSAHTIWHERSHHLTRALTSYGVRWLSRRSVKTLVGAKK